MFKMKNSEHHDVRTCLQATGLVHLFMPWIDFRIRPYKHAATAEAERPLTNMLLQHANDAAADAE